MVSALRRRESSVLAMLWQSPGRRVRAA